MSLTAISLAANVLVRRQDGALILVDYDGVYIPAFKGRQSPAIGQANFQHPCRGKNDFDENIDAFSALVIYTALLALSLRPELWFEYQDSESLLFKQDDFNYPEQSKLIKDLEQLPDPRMKTAIRDLKDACKELDVQKIRLPEYARASQYEQKAAARRTFQAAIDSTSASQIVTAYRFLPSDLKQSLDADQRECVQAAHRYWSMHQAIKRCISSGNHALLRRVYNQTLAHQFNDLSSDKLYYIQNLPNVALAEALACKDYHNAFKLARELLKMPNSHLDTYLAFQLSCACRDVISQQELRDFRSHPKLVDGGLKVSLSWRWPSDPLVQHAILLLEY